jgi:hypothetical protein
MLPIPEMVNWAKLGKAAVKIASRMRSFFTLGKYAKFFCPEVNDSDARIPFRAVDPVLRVNHMQILAHRVFLDS